MHAEKSHNAAADPSKAFNCLIDAPGQLAMKKLNLFEEMKTHGVGQAEFEISRMNPDDKMPQDPITSPTLSKDNPETCWIPRCVFLELLWEAAEKQPNAQLIASATVKNAHDIVLVHNNKNKK